MMWRRLQSDRWRLLSALVLLPALIGSFAACVLCDTDLCCDDSDCTDSACYCACAFHATSDYLTPSTPVMDSHGFIKYAHDGPVPQDTPRDLYRPPRSSASA